MLFSEILGSFLEATLRYTLQCKGPISLIKSDVKITWLYLGSQLNPQYCVQCQRNVFLGISVSNMARPQAQNQSNPRLLIYFFKEDLGSTSKGFTVSSRFTFLLKLYMYSSRLVPCRLILTSLSNYSGYSAFH